MVSSNSRALVTPLPFGCQQQATKTMKFILPCCTLCNFLRKSTPQKRDLSTYHKYKMARPGILPTSLFAGAKLYVFF
jgi:hypothetical protein